MVKSKNHYIKYKLAELESYINNPESCVKKSNCVERLRFAPNIIGNFKESIMKILSRKIGKYDIKKEGVVLDFRNTKVLSIQSDIRNDSAYSIINVESNFYIFSPRKDAIVDGIVKHINYQSIETIISVVIYRVFNVKVTFKGCIKKDQVTLDQVIKIRIKQFHFENEIPYIEGEMISSSKTALNTRKVFDNEILDSGISESSQTFENSHLDIKIKTERESSGEPPASTSKNATAKKTSKRKMTEDSSLSPSKESNPKRIKQEPPSEPASDNEHVNNVSIKQERLGEDNSELETTLNESSTGKSKKKKDKKKKKERKTDDFEAAFEMLINTSLIKSEKD